MGERGNLLDFEMDNQKEFFDQLVLSTCKMKQLELIAKKNTEHLKLKRFDSLFDIKFNVSKIKVFIKFANLLKKK